MLIQKRKKVINKEDIDDLGNKVGCSQSIIFGRFSVKEQKQELYCVLCAHFFWHCNLDESYSVWYICNLAHLILFDYCLPQSNQHHTLIVEEFEPDVFRQLIEYIHTGCVTLQPRTLLGTLAMCYTLYSLCSEILELA
ncbi:hypothetical protein RUM43_014097 [Polyplax serrata]|uniref:BTB domain-containing protein n=1 Tax=Polyplax serrata TaxID=468196 RepID=A0AAN8S2R9_POLSC